MSENNMLVPLGARGDLEQIGSYAGYEWIQKLSGKKIYFSLFQRWPSQSRSNTHLPLGYDFYIVSFHLEAVDINWLSQQKVDGPILVLHDGYAYDCKLPGVEFFTFYYWHYQLNNMQAWFGIKSKLQPKYKFSAVCNRLTQSKVWITTKLLQTANASSLIKLGDWMQGDSLHNWQDTGSSKLDELTRLFVSTYLGQVMTIDDFDNALDNHQKYTANPWQPLYQDCAIHFTNESFHYSFMHLEDRAFTWPGPFITEKTLKCLLGQTAFVPIGQFETYKTLTDLGFIFEYGFDCAWDLDAGNLSRAEKIIDLIDYLNQFDPEQLHNMTREASQHNQNHVTSGNFFQICQKINAESIDRIVNTVS